MSEHERKNLGAKWLLIGAWGFGVGFFGPLIFAPDANQGPLLGIFITGPGGLALGALGWFLSRQQNLSYRTQMRVAVSVGFFIALSVVISAAMPKPEWPGRIYRIQVTRCSPTDAINEVILETEIVDERIVKLEKPLFKEPFYHSGSIRTKDVQHLSFYARGDCTQFPIGFSGEYFVSNHPEFPRDKAVLEPLPEFAKEL